MRLTDTALEFAKDVRAERERQDELWGPVEDRDGSFGFWLAVLVEEVGEVANAMLEEMPWDEVRTELVQVAAVCQVWAEWKAAHDG